MTVEWRPDVVDYQPPGDDLIARPIFPIRGLVYAADLLVDDFVHADLLPYRITEKHPQVNGTVRVGGVISGSGRRITQTYVDSEQLDVTRLVDENLEH